MASIPDEIERLALIGWHLYPVSPTTKKACIKAPTDAATCDLDQLATWCGLFPGCGWRVVFGPSRLLGLDCDTPPGHAHDGIANLAALVVEHGPLPPRPQLRSGGGGLALFFQNNGERIVGHDGCPALGIDPRRGRQSQVVPPSLHWRTRRPYRWLTAPWETSPPPLPGWLARLMAPPPEPERKQPVLRTGDQARNYAVGALRNAIRRVAALGKGGRNNALNAETYSLARFVDEGSLTESEVRESMLAAARANGFISEEGIRAALATIDSGLKSRRAA